MKPSISIIPKILLLLLLMATALHGTAQYPTNANDLRTLSRTAKHDTTKAQALLFLAVLLRDTQPDSVLPLCDASIRIVDEWVKPGLSGPVLKPDERKAYRRIKATGKLNLGHVFHERGDSAKAMTLYSSAYTEFKQMGFRRGAGDAMAAMGALHTEIGNIDVGTYMTSKVAGLYKGAPNIPYGSIGFRPATSNSDALAETAQSPEILTQDPVVEQVNAPVVTTPPQPTGSNKLLATDTPSQGIRRDPVSGMVSLIPTFPETEVVPAPGPGALTRIGIDTAVIAKHRDRLSQPVRKDGGPKEAREQFELGEAWELMREPTLAMTSFKRSQKLFNTLRSDSGECVALLRIGKLRGERREYEEAFAVLDSARQKARTIGSRDLEGIALAGMGDMCRRIEECGGATELYRRSIELANATGDRRTEARGYLGMTEELVKSGTPSKAAPLGQKGLDLATEVDDAELKQQGAVLMRAVFASLGRLEESQEMGELAQKMEAYLAERDHVMDSIITGILTNTARTRERDSLEHYEVRSALESNLMGERVKAANNRNVALIISLCALVVIVLGIVYYRFDRRRRQARAERVSIELEVKALRAQMNPHFIFNALNSINGYILENDKDLASGFLTKFSRLMRLVLENSQHAEVPLEQDLECLRLYMDLERSRMQGKFDYTIEVGPAVDQTCTMVPPLMIQPFVENAIWHGISRKEGNGHIRVAISRSDGNLSMVVSDDGVGRPTLAQQELSKDKGHRSLGTQITRDRLDMLGRLKGSIAGFRYRDVAVGTTVEVTVPLMVG